MLLDMLSLRLVLVPFVVFAFVLVLTPLPSLLLLLVDLMQMFIWVSATIIFELAS